LRVSYEDLKKLCEALGTDRLNSWSRVNCVHNSLYEYLLKYILHIKEDRDDSIYKVTGGISHDIMERFYTHELDYDKMAEEFDDGWMTAFDVAELKFVRGDGKRNQSIADKYYYDLKNFFETHEIITEPIDIEQFVTVKVGDEYYQGYIDALISHKDGSYTILDWKTSSIYKGDKAKNECGQLVMYSLALHQKGIPFDKIKIAWNFLKYQCVTVQSKKGVKKVREIERCTLGEKLQANAKMWLKEFGYTEDQVFEYLDKLAQTNDIKVLPEEVQEKYEFHDCYVYVELTQELIDYWTNFIIDTMKEIRSKEAQYEELKEAGKYEEADKLWWEEEESVKKQSYYLSNLCGYSPNLHKPYKAYLEALDAQKNGDILGTKKKSDEEYAIDDLGWLNNL
jgi:hypothetical protein